MSEDRMAYFIDLVERNEPGEIEMARDIVTREDVGPLAEVYWNLESWDQKAGLIELVQDYIDPRTRDIMLDFLKAPTGRPGSPSGPGSPGGPGSPDRERDDYFEVVKAIALCHLDRDFAAFDRYYRDRQRLHATAERYLREAEV